MKNLFLLTVLVVATSALPSGLPNLKQKLYFDGRIVGGEIVNIEEAPYQVSIKLFNQFHCGGSIIANEWILTAAHCALYPPQHYEIRTGSDTPRYGGSPHKVIEKYIHEDFVINGRGVPRNDIALFRLDKPIEMNKKQKAVKLFGKDEEIEVGSFAVITGYGQTENSRISSTLRSVVVPMISREDCFKAYVSRFGGIEEDQICASYPNGGKDACAGDSGGPLTIGGRLAGIVSWGEGCGIAGNPGVYTDVSKHHDWITATTGLDL